MKLLFDQNLSWRLAEALAARRRAAVSIIRGNLSVSPVRGSRLVAIGYDNPNPVVAARIANGFAENFIQSNLDRKFQSSSYAREFLEERIVQTKGRLESAERQLVAYAANQQIVNVSVPREDGAASESLTSSNLVALNDALVASRAERVAAEARWRSASTTDPMSLPEVLQNAVVQQLSQQRNELEAVFSSMADSVVAIDADKKIIRMNQAATTLFALPSEVVKGKAVQGVIRNAYLLELIDFTLTHNTQQEQKVTLFNGTDPIILQTHAVPLRDEENKSMGVLLVMNDLTKLNRLENIRQDFVANVSHELKTPITAIKGYVETLLDGALDDKDTARRFLDIVGRQSNRLDAIVDDLLTLSRIEDHGNKNEITLTVDKIGPVLESALQTCAVHADEKHIMVRIECDEDPIAPINTPLLEQAVINLLTNAIAYSPEGSLITLRCRGSKNRRGEEFVHISVVDNGPGIAKEHLPRLFERFYRCDKARGRDQGGTGLGLAIVKHIAQAHNGTVEVESVPGKGSAFTITLPSDLTENNPTTLFT